MIFPKLSLVFSMIIFGSNLEYDPAYHGTKQDKSKIFPAALLSVTKLLIFYNIFLRRKSFLPFSML